MSAQKYKWLPFWSLEREEAFNVGKKCYEKLWGIFAAPCFWVHFLQLRVVLPWTRVKTTRPYGRIVPHPFPTELQTLTGEGPTVNVTTSEP